MKRIGLGVVALVILLVLGAYLLQTDVAVAPTTDEQEANQNSDFMYLNASSDNIKVDLPFPGATVGRDFTVRGQARGTWFFEASFPVGLVDANGTVIASGVAQAGGEWMTENFVSFAAEMNVPKSFSGPVTLVLQKDNPSGMPEKDAYVSFGITVTD